MTAHWAAQYQKRDRNNLDRHYQKGYGDARKIMDFLI